MHDGRDVEFLEVRVFLPNPNVKDGLRGRVNQRQGSSDLIINRIELRQQNSIDFWLKSLSRFLLKCLVELGDLIHCIIACKSLTNEDHKVRFVHLDQSCEFLHEGSVVLHAACGVDQNSIDVLPCCLNEGIDTSLMA